MNTRRIGVSSVLAIAILLGAPGVHAQVDAAAKATARPIAEEALALFDKGRWLAALDKFNRADELVHAPTMALGAAHCLEKLGRLVEASERYRDVSRAHLDTDASDSFKNAVATAEKEYKTLLPRLPKVILGLRGAAATEVEISIDGKRVGAAIVGIERLTDPGHHTVQAKRGGDVATEEVDLKEGDAVEVTLDLGKAVKAPLPGGGEAEVGSTQRAVGWTAVAVGGAGLIFGGVTLALRTSAGNTLQNNPACNAQLVCQMPAWGEVDHYDTLKPMPIAGFVAGGAVLAAGMVVLLTAPRPRPAGGSLRLLPWVGPQGGGVTGVF
jgi:hypothetical protein